MSTSIKTAFFKTLFFTALTAISTLGFLPDYDALPPIVSFSDLLNHTVAFTVLFILFRLSYPALMTKHIIIALSSYALLIEAVQYYLPTRYAAWSDIGADIAGILIGYFLMILFRRLPYTKNLFS